MRPALATLGENPTAAPALVGVSALLFFAADEGGYAASTWLPVALLLGGLLLVALTVGPAPVGLRAPATVALLLMLAYAGWSYLSITWADQRADAWDGANRALLYAVIFGLFALWPLRYRAALLVLSLFAIGIAVIGFVELVRVAAAADPSGYFNHQRLSEPTGYSNANAALWTLGAMASVFLATRPELPPLVRGASAGGATLLVGLALMGGSRGWVLAVPLGVLALTLLVRERARLLCGLLLVVAVSALTAGPVLDVYERPEEALPPLLDEAAGAILAGAAAVAVTALALAYLEGRFPVSRTLRPKIDRAVLILVVVAMAASAAGAELAGDPRGAAADAWAEFRSGDPTVRPGSRIADPPLGSNRYQLWRVAWGAFRDHPARGIGADNFLQRYLLRGHTREEPRYPHSFELGVLSQTGVVGALLLGGALLLAVAAALRSVVRAPPATASLAGAALAMFVYWLAHGSGDWFWEFPALAGTGVACLGLASALGAKVPAPSGPALGTRAGRVAVAAVGAVAAAALVLPWLAERQTARAASSWRADPAGALERLDAAAGQNPLSPEPKLTAALIAVRLHRLDLAEQHFRAALDREPNNAYAHLQLGAVASELGHRQEAMRHVAEARRLSPRDPLAAAALRRLRRGARLRAQDVSRGLLERVERRLR